MLRWISKSGTLIQFTLFAAILSVLWIPAIVHPISAVNSSVDGPLYSMLISWMRGFPMLTVTLALLMVVIQALILFYIFQANGFFGRNNFLPAIIILLAFSWNPAFQTMHALLPALLFVILALYSILSMYGQQSAYHQVFTAALSIGIASLFYLPVAYLLLFVWFSLVTYRISGWREYVISILGFSIPYIYYASWLFWNDNVTQGFTQLSESLFYLIRPPGIPVVPMIWLSVSVFVLVVTMVAVLNVMSDKLISLRRRSWVIFNLTFVSLVATLLVGWPILSANYFFVIPLSFFLTGSFTLIRRPFWFEILASAYFLLLVVIRVYMLIEFQA